MTLPSGRLAVNGLQPNRPDSPPGLVLVGGGGSVGAVSARAIDAAPSGAKVIYADDAWRIGEVAFGGGAATVLASNALPMNPFPRLATDNAGRIWFSMLAYNDVGIGWFDPASKTLSRFPFPWVGQNGSDTGPGAVCGGDPQCEHPSQAPTLDPQVQAIVCDPHGGVWAITSLPGSGLANETTPFAPIYEISQSV